MMMGIRIALALRLRDSILYSLTIAFAIYRFHRSIAAEGLFFCLGHKRTKKSSQTEGFFAARPLR
jgi:hypothetical protein